MSFIDMINNNKTWLFSGAGLVIAGAIYRISKAWFTNNPWRGSKSIENTEAHHPFIEREFEFRSGNAKLYLVTFIPNKKRKHSFEEKWVEHKHIPIETEDNEIKISKSEINNHLEDKKYPFKFVVEVDNEKEIIRDYYQKLVSADLTVTGKGTPSKYDKRRWQIWFLFNGQPFHPDIYSIVTLNHTLFPNQ